MSDIILIIVINNVSGHQGLAAFEHEGSSYLLVLLHLLGTFCSESNTQEKQNKNVV